MARPANPPYTLGKVSISDTRTTANLVQARGYYNNAAGKRREVTATGKSEAAAKRALQAKVQEARDKYEGGDSTLNHDTKVSRAADVWLERKGGEGLRPRTLSDYESYVKLSIKQHAIGTLTLTQANRVSVIEDWLTDIANNRGEVAARQSRKVLTGILGMAERRDAIPASVMGRAKTPKPKSGSDGDNRCRARECDYDCGRRHLDTKRAFTEEEFARVLDVAQRMDRGEIVRVRKGVSGKGKPHPTDIADLVAFLYGTGVRISEALECVEWSDVDLGSGEVRVRGTKTESADRVLRIPDWVAERLSARAALYGTTGHVFGITRLPAKLGKPRGRDNVCKQIREVFVVADVRWAGTHTFRRTVATMMDAKGAGLAEIANQLGHADTNVTARYLSRNVAPTRAASIMTLPPSSAGATSK